MRKLMPAKAAARRPSLSHLHCRLRTCARASIDQFHNIGRHGITIGQNKLRAIRQVIEDCSYLRSASRRWRLPWARLRIGPLYILLVHSWRVAHPPYFDDCWSP
ncbi:hypothetical protein GWK47_049694 [Chionoecetes opilio]|uniref:Uncharacterized protein n=1 Tax=Chionoecetes opilio TaxID=41210 RepID=A0A8J4YBJ2_CHIOP|nr:hypothetical protein GWK47_049694 [Chionoecetes opilio]